ncbi:MAG TPA: 3D domain-containing protein [Polyangiaceae bacterium]
MRRHLPARANRGRTWRVKALALALLLSPTACATAGSAWMREGYRTGTNTDWSDDVPTLPPNANDHRPARRELPTRTLGEPTTSSPDVSLVTNSEQSVGRIELRGNGQASRSRRGLPAVDTRKLEGRVLGTFRNTYYDFPNEADFNGDRVAVHNAQCKPIAQVARGFYEALCVQGSGLLANGTPVSFHRRDCDCAEICPKTEQRICFDTLDLAKYPWGRGASGGPITPLLTVAVDTSVIPMGTALYIPEYDGLPRDASRKSLHDGCFVAQDRGLRVTGLHVDVFTGQRVMTEMWNGLVPSNRGVTVVLDSPKCARDSN